MPSIRQLSRTVRTRLFFPGFCSAGYLDNTRLIFSGMLRQLFKPIDIAPLVYFRILGGLLITTEITAEIFTHYRVDLTESQFQFSYPYFEWVVRWCPSALYPGKYFGYPAGIAFHRDPKPLLQALDRHMDNL